MKKELNIVAIIWWFCVLVVVASVTMGMITTYRSINESENKVIHNTSPIVVYNTAHPYIRPIFLDPYYHFLIIYNGKRVEVIIPAGKLRIKSRTDNKKGVLIAFKKFSQINPSSYLTDRAVVLVPQKKVREWKDWIKEAEEEIK